LDLAKYMALIGNKTFRPVRIKNFSKRMVKKYEQVVDLYDEQLRELCAVRNPGLRTNPKMLREKQTEFISKHFGKRKSEECGAWFFFPWLGTYVHYLESELHEELRTARNKNLITIDEQLAFHNFPIAVAGLSVGSHAALSIVLQGGGSDLRLTDPDIISGSNLNRIRTGFQSVGQKKTSVAAREIYTMNPYAKLQLYPSGLSQANIKKFLTHPKPVGVVIEETDDLELKISIRIEAKKLRIPVIMAADNGDGVILDVERYDLDPDTPMLQGRAEGITPEMIRKATPAEFADILTKVIDPSAVVPRMRSSVGEVGKTLYSWPQLGGAAQMAGVVLAYAARMIATGQSLKSGRTIISLENILSNFKI
jgi:molybdopterin/thiamine biosynthesis adenylyltransferase